MKFGDHFGYIGGSFTLTPKNIDRAIKIISKELAADKKRLKLWHENPQHPSFAHDMQWHGSRCIDNLLNGHLIDSKRKMKALQSLIGSQLTIEFE